MNCLFSNLEEQAKLVNVLRKTGSLAILTGPSRDQVIDVITEIFDKFSNEPKNVDIVIVRDKDLDYCRNIKQFYPETTFFWVPNFNLDLDSEASNSDLVINCSGTGNFALKNAAVELESFLL